MKTIWKLCKPNNVEINDCLFKILKNKIQVNPQRFNLNTINSTLFE